MHHPVSFDPFSSSASIEDEGFLQSNTPGAIRGVDGAVSASGLPKSSSSHPVGSSTVSVFSVSWAVEIPLLLPCGRQLFLQKPNNQRLKQQLNIKGNQKICLCWYLTWKIPWIIFVDIHLLDQLNRQRPLLNLPL